VRRDPNDDNLAIITDDFARWPATRTAFVFLVLSLVGGAAAAFYAWHDLTLSHYDARAHLVVARRITDSLTPGWEQIGAVWLPLPHLLNAGPVALDWNYHTGASAVLLSVTALALGLTLAARHLYERTGSAASAVAVAALVLLNPNVLYLQSTPMTEPMLFGLSLAAVVAVDRWIRAPSTTRRRAAGLSLAALVLTRYEGWCIAAALGALIVAACRRQPWRAIRVLVYPAAAVAAFLLLSWGSTGRWFVTSGFFVPDNPARHRPGAVIVSIVGSVAELGGGTLLGAAFAGIVALAWSARRRLVEGAPLALLAAGALPALAFYQGHPHRIRYMVPLVVAAGVLAAFAVGRVPRRVRGLAAAALVAAVLIERPPLDPAAPMLLEAQWETPYRVARDEVAHELRARHDGRMILASMGSLGHFMQESSRHGFALDDFLHEGNGGLWTAALEAPGRHVGWILIEERAEGGDQLAARARADGRFLDGFARVTESGGLALYRRIPD
jgi:hypothetical protein